MLKLEQVKEKLKDANLTKVSLAAGVHYNSVYNLMRGGNPSYATVEKLSNYLEGKNNAPS